VPAFKFVRFCEIEVNPFGPIQKNEYGACPPEIKVVLIIPSTAPFDEILNGTRLKVIDEGLITDTVS
jgi:hypothetical protein